MNTAKARESRGGIRLKLQALIDRGKSLIQLTKVLIDTTQVHQCIGVIRIKLQGFES